MELGFVGHVERDWDGRLYGRDQLLVVQPSGQRNDLGGDRRLTGQDHLDLGLAEEGKWAEDHRDQVFGGHDRGGGVPPAGQGSDHHDRQESHRVLVARSERNALQADGSV
uniref:(northern house mosquito) hypothetical protein n=1 Tax=Culex pipiens TaxID=7175 RepID=A0A8D8AWA4_CULPI